MAQKCAFEAAVEGLSGASVQTGEGETFNITAALKTGNGQIVLNPDTQAPLIAALNHHPAVKPATVKTAAAKTTKEKNNADS